MLVYLTTLQDHEVLTSDSKIKDTFVVAFAFVLCVCPVCITHFIKNLLQEKWFKISFIKRFKTVAISIFEE